MNDIRLKVIVRVCSKSCSLYCAIWHFLATMTICWKLILIKELYFNQVKTHTTIDWLNLISSHKIDVKGLI